MVIAGPNVVKMPFFRALIDFPQLGGGIWSVSFWLFSFVYLYYCIYYYYLLLVLLSRSSWYVCVNQIPASHTKLWLIEACAVWLKRWIVFFFWSVQFLFIIVIMCLCAFCL